jgi:hypothetical protein
LTSARQGTSGDQKWNGGQRQPDLLREDGHKQDQGSVLRQKVNCFVHTGLVYLEDRDDRVRLRWLLWQ